MNQPTLQTEDHTQGLIKAPFNPLKVILPVLIALLSVSLMAQWYASNVTLPRFCKDPQQTLHQLSKLLDDEASIHTEQRRQTMIAAKLLFLNPMHQDESKPDYLRRLNYFMLNQCN
ncbi:MAG: hypothetical protein GY744_09660 [Gammaproteobacteria bacterium]|nr:hypothetical protein [Gammaproteobacteria bacterium]